MLDSGSMNREAEKTGVSPSRAGAAPASAVPPASRLSLLCLSGQYTGREHPLPGDRPLIIGRGRQADIRIEDHLTSRQHTKLYFADGQFVVEDLGSKNGTYLNGKRVDRAPLKAGDYLKVGESSFHLIQPCVVEDKARSWWEKTQHTFATMKMEGDRSPGAASSISGTLLEVSLLDLLQLLANAAKTGVVTLRCRQDKGEIFLRQGQIYYAMINHQPPRHPDKVVYRMLRWREGAFTFTPNAEHLAENEIQESTGALLLEGVRQADELTAFRDTLPPLGAVLRPVLPLPTPLRDLTPAELDLMQLVLEQGTLAGVLDAFPGSDLDACAVLDGLFKRGLLRAETEPQPSAAGSSMPAASPEKTS